MICIGILVRSAPVNKLGPSPPLNRYAVKIVFQPLIDLRKNSLLGFEALARFKDGQSPTTHFRQARDEGRLVELEHRAIDLVIEASHSIPDGLLVTFNASGESIQAFSKFPHRLDPRLKWGLELTEETSPGCSCGARKVADELGALLLVDDAGAAFSNQERILTSSPDIVKFDRPLIWNYNDCMYTKDKAHSLLAAAQHAGAKTLAEGIETPEHLDLVMSLGFDYAQGFYYSPGVAPEELADAMRTLQGRVGIDVPGF